MAQLTSYGVKYLTSCIFGKTKTPLTNTYFGLALTAPVDSTNGSGLSEPSTSYGYARKTYSNSSSGYSANVFAKKVVSNVVTLLTESNHSLSANQTVYVYLGDPQIDKNRKTVDNWNAEYATLASASTNVLTYNLTTSNLGGTVASYLRASNVVTLTTGAAHNLVAGQTVYISGNTNASFDGIYQITEVPSTTSIKYANVGPDVSSTNDTAGSVYATSVGTVTPFYNIVGTRQISTSTASFFTDTNPGLVSADQLQIFSGLSASTPSVSNSVISGLSIGSQFVSDNTEVSSSQASLNLISYANSTFEGTHTWTVTSGTGTSAVVSKSSVGDTNSFKFSKNATGTTSTIQSDYIPVSASTRYGIGADVLIDVAATSILLQVTWFNGTTIIGSPATVQTLTYTPNGSWTTMYDTADSPGTATNAKISVVYTIATAAVSNLSIRKPMLAKVPTLSSITGASGSGTNYMIRISAITAAGETPPSNAVTVATTGVTTLTANWSAFSGATGYKIYCAYGVIEDSVSNQPYINSQFVAVAGSVTTLAFSTNDVATTGYTKSRVANWFPGGYSITVNKSVSSTELGSYISDTIFSPSYGGTFSYGRLLPNWQPALDGKVYNGKTIKFGPASTTTWGTVRYWFMADSSTGGNVIAFGELSDPIYVEVGDSITIPTNGISFNVFSGYGS